MQTSIFNLLQACAYRVFRHAYACDYHSHERDPKYPYLFSNFVQFAKVGESACLMFYLILLKF